MLLTATGVELPSDDWKIQKFKENKAFSEETMCFTAEIVHIPTKQIISIGNDGHGGADIIHFDHSHPQIATLKAEWKNFVESCRPALQESVKNEPAFANLYDYKEDGYNHPLDESVIGLFTAEASEQKFLSGKRGLVVRNPQEPQEMRLFKPADTDKILAGVGNIQGEYWDKKSKSWVAL